MAVRSTAEEMERLQLSDDDTEDLWNSPSKRAAKKTSKSEPVDQDLTEVPQHRQNGGDTLFDREEAREAALHNELQAVRNINEVIEGLLNSIDRAKGNMEVSLDMTDITQASSPNNSTDRIQDSNIRIDPSQHMD